MACESAVAAFRRIWSDIYGEDAWDAGPEVVVAFTVHPANIDGLGGG